MLETERLILEPLGVQHADRMFAGLADPALYVFLPDEPPPTIQALRQRYSLLADGAGQDSNERWLNWVLRDKASDQLIGYTQVTVRANEPSLLAYLIFQPRWRQGYACEAVAATIASVFSDYDTVSMDAFIDTRNLGSHKLVEKLGFECEQTIEQADFFKGQSSDEYQYRLPRPATA